MPGAEIVAALPSDIDRVAWFVTFWRSRSSVLRQRESGKSELYVLFADRRKRQGHCGGGRFSHMQEPGGARQPFGLSRGSASDPAGG